jgi:hypothetical protein
MNNFLILQAKKMKKRNLGEGRVGTVWHFIGGK